MVDYLQKVVILCATGAVALVVYSGYILFIKPPTPAPAPGRIPDAARLASVPQVEPTPALAVATSTVATSAFATSTDEQVSQTPTSSLPAR